MKLFMKLMLALLVLAILLPFTLLKNDQGRPLMSFSEITVADFKFPDLGGAPSGKSLLPSDTGPGDLDRFYKWYDAEGELQFTTEPPPDGIKYTIKEVDPNANLIQSVTLTAEEVAPQYPGVTNPSAPGQPLIPQNLGDIYDKDSIQNLIDNAKNLEQQLHLKINNQNSAIY